MQRYGCHRNDGGLVLADAKIVADAGMVSQANRKEIEALGLSFILDLRIAEVPHVIAQWHASTLASPRAPPPNEEAALRSPARLRCFHFLTVSEGLRVHAGVL
jgi:hypothetical protein